MDLEQPSAPAQDSAPGASLFAAPVQADNKPAEATPAATEQGGDDGETVLVKETPQDSGKPDELDELAKLLPADDALEDIEHDGIKAKVPKALKEAFLRHQDYTRKTQEVAEMRRDTEARQQALAQQAEFQQKNIQEFAQLHSISARGQWIMQNLAAVAAQDPQQAQRLQIELAQLQATQGQLTSSLTQRNQQMQFAAQQAEAKRANDAEAVVMREVKDWSPDKYRELQLFARTQGVEPEAMRRMLIEYPQMAKVLSNAATFDRVLKQRAAKPPVAPAPKPITRVGGGGATNTKSLSDLTPEEWAAKRRERNTRR